MELKERLNTFKAELGLIGRKDIKDFTKACIAAAPDYVFEDCPSSTTGKYHPVDELSFDGTIIHTKRVFAVAYDFATGLGIEAKRDIILSAALLHDLAKQGIPQAAGKHTVNDHPQIMAALIWSTYDENFRGMISEDVVNDICNAVFYHYGPWTANEYKKSMDDYTKSELAVYMADFIASKRFVKVDYRR